MSRGDQSAANLASKVISGGGAFIWHAAFGGISDFLGGCTNPVATWYKAAVPGANLVAGSHPADGALNRRNGVTALAAPGGGIGGGLAGIGGGLACAGRTSSTDPGGGLFGIGGMTSAASADDGMGGMRSDTQDQIATRRRELRLTRRKGSSATDARSAAQILQA